MQRPINVILVDPPVNDTAEKSASFTNPKTRRRPVVTLDRQPVQVVPDRDESPPLLPPDPTIGPVHTIVIGSVPWAYRRILGCVERDEVPANYNDAFQVWQAAGFFGRPELAERCAERMEELTNSFMEPLEELTNT